MHFPLSLQTTSLILLPFLQHISLAAPAPNPTSALAIRSASPLTIPYFSSGAALEISTGETRVYYQSNDGAIHERSGFKSPNSNNVYTDQVILAAGKAWKGTPLAVTNLITTGFVVVSAFPVLRKKKPPFSLHFFFFFAFSRPPCDPHHPSLINHPIKPN